MAWGEDGSWVYLPGMPRPLYVLVWFSDDGEAQHSGAQFPLVEAKRRAIECAVQWRQIVGVVSMDGEFVAAFDANRAEVTPRGLGGVATGGID